MNIFRIDAVYSVHPEAKSSDDDGFYDANGDKIVLDEDAVSKKEAEFKSASDAQAYARNRQEEYPDWGTQLNKIYDDGLTKWKSEMVDPVKAKWPKDNSGPK